MENQQHTYVSQLQNSSLQSPILAQDESQRTPLNIGKPLKLLGSSNQLREENLQQQQLYAGNENSGKRPTVKKIINKIPPVTASKFQQLNGITALQSVRPIVAVGTSSTGGQTTTVSAALSAAAAAAAAAGSNNSSSLNANFLAGFSQPTPPSNIQASNTIRPRMVIHSTHNHHTLAQRSLERDSDNTQAHQNQQQQNYGLSGNKSNNKFTSSAQTLATAAKRKMNGDMPVVTTQDILSDKKRLSLQSMLEMAGVNEIKDIVRISMRNENLSVFEPDFPLSHIQVIILSNNRLINLMGMVRLKTLRELDIENNYVQELAPLAQLENLQRLKANGNRITQIKSLGKLSKLQCLEIGNNLIADFDKTLDTLQELDSLSELVFADNPASKKRQWYKFDLLWALNLKKLDLEVVQEKDIELSKQFNLKRDVAVPNNGIQQQQVKYDDDELSQEQCFLAQSQQLDEGRPNTVHGRPMQVRGVANNMQTLKVKDLEKRLQDAEKNLQAVRTQLDQVLQEKEALEDENENNYVEIDELRARVEELEKKNEELVFETSFACDLQRENLDLRRKVAAYEHTMLFKDANDAELKQQVYYLNKKLEDLEHEKRELKEQNARLKEKIVQ